MYVLKKIDNELEDMLYTFLSFKMKEEILNSLNSENGDDPRNSPDFLKHVSYWELRVWIGEGKTTTTDAIPILARKQLNILKKKANGLEVFGLEKQFAPIINGNPEASARFCAQIGNFTLKGEPAVASNWYMMASRFAERKGQLRR